MKTHDGVRHLSRASIISVMLTAIAISVNHVYTLGAGTLLLGATLLVVPAVLSRIGFFKQVIAQGGYVRYSVLVGLLLFMASLPIKMVLRWTINLKYLVAIPEYFFNI